jgi:hypothetical protein
MRSKDWSPRRSGREVTKSSSLGSLFGAMAPVLARWAVSDAVPHEQLSVADEDGLRSMVMMPLDDLQVASRRQGEVLPGPVVAGAATVRAPAMLSLGIGTSATPPAVLGK